MPADTISQDAKHYAGIQTLTVPFQIPSRGPCTATITVQPNDDSLHTGQDLVDLYTDPSMVKGFPLLQATISSPNSRMYAAIYGWIQVRSIPSEPWEVDIYPPFEDLNYPFFFWGPEPTCIDAPGREMTDSKWEGHDWFARTFLTYDPKAAMDKVATPILGFQWGFLVRNGKVVVKELELLDVNVWNEHLDLLRSKFPGWEFKEATSD